MIKHIRQYLTNNGNFLLLSLLMIFAPWLRFYWDNLFIFVVFSIIYLTYLWQIRTQRNATMLPLYPTWVVFILLWKSFLYFKHGQHTADIASIFNWGCAFLLLPLVTSLKKEQRAKMLFFFCCSSLVYALFYLVYIFNLFAALQKSIELFLNHNVVAAYFIFVFFAAWQLWQQKNINKYFLLFIFCLVLTALAATQSRLAIITLVIAATIGFLYRYQYKKTLLLFAGFLLLLLSMQTTNSLADRWVWWQKCWNLFLQNPWLGNGCGSFEKNFAHAGMGLKSIYAHSYPLQMAAEEGLVSCFLLLSYTIFLLKRCDWRNTTSSAIIAVWLQSLFDFPLNIFGIFLLFWFFIALSQKVEG